MNLTPEKKKQALMLALLLLLGVIGYFQFFSGSGDDETTTTARARQTTRTGAAAGKGVTTSSGKNALPVIDSPLELAAMTNKAQQPTAARNIFVYPPPPTPTPLPTPVPVLPPPITLSGANPGGVIGRTGDFTLTLMGAKFPPDARAFISGREHQTTFVNDTQLKVAVPAMTIANPGTLPIEVRSASDPKLFSNVINLNVTPPPVPPYKYLGLYIKNGVKTAVLKFDLDNDLLNVREGAVLGGHWKIIGISDQKVDFEDTNIRINHSVMFTGEGG